MCEPADSASPFDRLLGAVAAYLSRPRELDREPADIAQDMIRMRRALDMLELDFARKAAQFAATDECDKWAALSPIGWMQDNCRMAGHAAASAICVGRKAEGLLRSTEAMSAGRIGFAQLALLAHTAEAVEASGATMNEQRLLRQAEAHTPHRFRRDCAHARHAADAAAFLAEQRDAVEARFLELKPVGDNGCLWIKGFLDPEGGAIVRAALEPLARRCGVDDDRLLPQRLGDALVEIHAHVLDTGLDTGKAGTGRRQVPQLQVTAPLDTLLGLVDAPAGELDGDTPISTSTVQRIACTANIVRVLLDPASAVIDVGRARRLPSPGTRRAVEHRDTGCVWPVCNRKVKWTQIHHVVHWV